MNFKSLLISISLMLTTAFVVNAQNSISGKVTDGIESVAGANVILQGTNIGVSTDNNGMFTLNSDQGFPGLLSLVRLDMPIQLYKFFLLLNWFQ